ncbi:hypothetical protein SRB17_80690 [Streptomyces sp. RB17]|nr:hypothetical protein [Streptomyces sp. RB17]
MPAGDGKVEVRLQTLKDLRRAEIPAVTAAAQRIWEQGLQPATIRIRRSYVRNETMKRVEDERKPLPMADRPLSARMIAPKGVALKFHLTQLFAAQCAVKPGKPWPHPYPVEPTVQSDASWAGLVAVHATYKGPGIQGASVATNKRRQLTQALKKLEGLALIRATTGPGRARQGFEMLCENGKSTAAAGIPYSVPSSSEAYLEVPREFFTNGWVHVLTMSEIAALLMWLDALKFDPTRTSDTSIIVTRVTSDTRQGFYGLGRETYETHQQLDAFQLLDVIRPEERHYDGKWEDYKQDTSDLFCHRVTPTPQGFQRKADDVVLEVLQRRDILGTWSRSPNAPVRRHERIKMRPTHKKQKA